MAIFANLELESRLQLEDRTRIKADKSYITIGAGAITDVTITPGADGPAISVFDADQTNWFLDYQFETWNGDFDATNNKIDFSEDGGTTELTATISPATYALAGLATEIKTRLDAAGAFTYTVTVDKNDKFTISATGNFSLLPNTGTNSNISALPLIGISSKPGFDDNNFSNKLEIVGKRVRFLPKAILLTITDGVTPDSQTLYMNIYSRSGDNLFSTDADIAVHKSDIMKWTEVGRNTFKKYHRYAQDEIIDYARRSGVIDIDGNPLELVNYTNAIDLKKWSTFTTLRLIMDDISNSVGDIFELQARNFEGKEMRHRNMAFLRVDIDNDGQADIGEGIKVRSARLIRQ